MLQPLEISDLSLDALTTPTTRNRLMSQLEVHRLLIVRGLTVESEDVLPQLASVFGQLHRSLEIDTSHPIADGVQVMHRERPSLGDDAKRVPSSHYWHSDRSFLLEPPAVSILQAITVPSDGDTLFADLKGPFEKLSRELRERFRSIQLLHSYSHYHTDLQCDYFSEQEKRAAEARFPQVWHSLLLESPQGTWEAPYLSELCIAGLRGDDEAIRLTRDIFEEAVSVENVYRHQWCVGDIVIWLNVGTMHRGTPSSDERVLHRAVAGLVRDSASAYRVLEEPTSNAGI